MNQQLQTRQASFPPTEADLAKILSSPQLVEKLTACIAPGAAEYRPGTPITEDHRRMLVERADFIDSFAVDNRPDRTVAIVSTLLVGFPHRDMSDGTASMKLAAYRMALEGAPTWAVEEAAKRWLRNQDGDSGFAPTPPQLREAADDVVKVAKGKAIYMRKLAAMAVERVPTDAERKRVAAVEIKLQRMKKEAA